MEVDDSLHKELDRLFVRFLEFFAYQCCSCKSPWLWAMDEKKLPRRVVGCQRNAKDGKSRHPIAGYKHPEQAHHAGHLQQILSQGPAIPVADLRTWANDVPHGLVHGLCTAFMLFWLKYPAGITDQAFVASHDKRPESEEHPPEVVQQLLAALLHDFHRTLDQEKVGHDANLRALFPGLGTVTYRHMTAAPNERDLLVGADRLELRRFGHWKAWVDPEYQIAGIESLHPGLLSYFYENLRPAIAYLLQYRSAIWFRHGPERKAYSGVANFREEKWKPTSPFPRKSWAPLTEKVYCVETGRPPFEDCFWHGCGFQPWGLVPKPVAMRYATPRAIRHRDHLGLEGSIPLKHWVFTFCQKNHEPQLVQHGVGHMEMLTAQRMFAVVNRFLELFCALRVKEDDDVV